MNDLISRSKLKKAFNKWWGCDDIPATVVEDLIDNAPTVNLEKTSFMKGYNYGCDDGKRFYERPQGEWNYIQVGMCVCPFCGAYPHKDYKNFCPNCGADMRGTT